MLAADKVCIVCVCVCVCVIYNPQLSYISINSLSGTFSQLFSLCVLSRVRLSAGPGSSFHGIFLTRILEWVAISYSRGSS